MYFEWQNTNKTLCSDDIEILIKTLINLRCVEVHSKCAVYEV